MSMLKYFKFPFATSGDKTAVPDASQPSGSVSYTDGFTADYELDPGVDPAAKDVPRDETNQLFFDITTAIKELQSFGTPDFITTALNGGVAFSYSKYARVLYSDGYVYVSKKNANTSLPSVAADWYKLTDNADYLTIATTAFESSVADGEAVYWDSTNSRFDEAVADGTNKQNFIGFADVTNGRVFVYGLYAGQLSGLTANTVYYLSGVTPGAITTAVPSSNVVRVGIAKSATDLYVAGIPQQAAVVAASETVAGIAENATQAETDAGTAGNFSVTPAKLRNGFAISLTANGYIKLPSWLGGIILQWGSNAQAINTTVTVTYPLAFPTETLQVISTSLNQSGSALQDRSTQVGQYTASNFQSTLHEVVAGGTNVGVSWFAIGR